MIRLRAALLSILTALCLGDAIAAEPDGAALYTRCAACHLPDGRGIPGTFPPLGAQVAAFARSDPGRAYLVMVVATGLTGRLEVAARIYQGVMPAQSALGNAEIAAVLNHVLRTLTGSEAGLRDFDGEQVAQIRAKHASSDAAAVRRMRPEVDSGVASAMPGVDHPQRAQQSWMLNCRGCHGATAQAVSTSTPAIAGSVARFLSVSGGREYLVRVPGVASAPLADEQVAELLNWMIWTYDAGNVPRGFLPFSTAEVRRLRSSPLRTEASQVRAELLARIPRGTPGMP